MELSKLDTACKSYLGNWTEVINGEGVLGKGITMNEAGVLAISGEADIAGIKRSMAQFSDSERKSTALVAISRLAMADLLIAANAITGESIEELADTMGICDSYQRSIESIWKWVKTAKEIPPEWRDPRLSMNQMLCVATVKKPDDPKKLPAFRDALKKTLEKGAENPKEYGGRLMRKDLRAITGSIDTTGSATSKDRTIDLLHRLAIYNHAESIMDTDPDFFKGAISRGEIINQIESDRATLIDRGDLPVDPRDSVLFVQPNEPTEPIAVEAEVVS